jgi:hypothetical protein
VLFAALGITLTNNADDSLITLRHNLRLGIAFVGVAITIVVFLRVLAAARMHREWTREMEEIAKDIPDQVTFGNPPHWPSRLARRASLAMPLIFLAAWGYLLITCWCMPVR